MHVHVPAGYGRREDEHPLDHEADRRGTCPGQGALVPGRQLDRAEPDALSECAVTAR